MKGTGNGSVTNAAALLTPESTAQAQASVISAAKFCPSRHPGIRRSTAPLQQVKRPLERTGSECSVHQEVEFSLSWGERRGPRLPVRALLMFPQRVLGRGGTAEGRSKYIFLYFSASYSCKQKKNFPEGGGMRTGAFPYLFTDVMKISRPGPPP